jgi:2-polyprenyl-3-methyl-5-hydroxy-6-metoxy-1,4-benzoquinol methylase
MDDRVYPQMYRVEKEHWWFTARLGILLHFLHHRLQPSSKMRVLDVGCGTGAILEEFSRRFEAFGIDPSEQAIEFCRQRGLTNVWAGLLDDFPADRMFDLVTMFDVVEHVPDDVGLLKAARRHLVPGGHLLIAVPAFRWLWSRHDVTLHHQRRYTQSTLVPVVTAAGFAVEHVTYFNTLLFPLAVSRRFVQKLTGSETMDDLEIPAPAVNRLFRTIFEMETPVVPSYRIPFGLSLLCLARNPGP